MAPERRGSPIAGGKPRRAAVLVLLYPRADGELGFPLIVRGRNLSFHAGQIGLPGGALEDGESAAHAALRETAEEIGADPVSVDILGALSELHIPVSGYSLACFVGFAPARPDFAPQPGEVERILEAPLAAILDPGSRACETRLLQGERSRVPYFAICGEKVWGATAMILAELAAVLAEPARS
jgi:8-oxo-dGTP pyrophosphatase MutT (NUDIX family)